LSRIATLVAVLVVAVSTVLGVTDTVRADVNDFVIEDFVADYTLSKNDRQGELQVVEHIRVNFTDQNHGLLRAIPKSYKGHSLKLHIDQVSSSTAPAQYTTYTSNDNLVLKIGDPDRTVTGVHNYTIVYTVSNVVGFYDDHDELYWDINGDQWGQPFQHVTANIRLPNGLQSQEQACFAGSYGQNNKQCEIHKTDSGFTATASELGAYQTLTTVLAFPKGYFAAPTWIDWLHDYYVRILAIVVPSVIAGGWAFQRWWRSGRDLKGRGVIIPEYTPPDGLSAGEAGMIVDYRLDAKDVSAAIIDLAIRKYVRIIEKVEKKILKDKKTYEFELLRADFAELKSHEQKVLSDLFPNKTVGERVKLDSLNNKFYKTVQSLQESVPKDLTKAGYFTSNPKKAGNSLYVVGSVLLFVAFLVHSWISLGIGIGAAIVLIFALLMPKRSAHGVTAKENLEGLKMYMTVVEKDRIKMLQSPDAPYAEKSKAPEQTVELFEKLLPFAIVLGVENEWAKKFESIYTTPPDWYAGNWATFNAVYFTSSLNSSVSAMGTNFSPPSSSGSSGSSGGSSGGGGGGGGGGGW